MTVAKMSNEGSSYENPYGDDRRRGADRAPTPTEFALQRGDKGRQRINGYRCQARGIASRRRNEYRPAASQLAYGGHLIFRRVVSQQGLLTDR